eukprot:1161771-Pelagomonas_calceolata.AAC.1
MHAARPGVCNWKEEHSWQLCFACHLGATGPLTSTRTPGWATGPCPGTVGSIGQQGLALAQLEALFACHFRGNRALLWH